MFAVRRRRGKGLQKISQRLWQAPGEEHAVAAAYDLAITGGGINGCGIARDAAGRGLTVYLGEMGDLAGGTSSRSTGLIHGGLRYLEHYDFRLVREALREREVLWRIAPHIVRPLRFVLPYRTGLRAAWLLRLGLFVYDHLGGRKLLPPTRVLDLARDPAGAPLKSGVFRTGFEYSDCRVDDARLVLLNARDAADHGATIRTRTKVLTAVRRAAAWQVTIEDTVSGRRETIEARALVNAAGPWVAQTLAACLGRAGREHVRLVQGSHIVVPRLFDHDRAYLFQNPDGRIVFAIPYQAAYTLIGTTDRDFAGDPAAVAATAEEIAYLCDAASFYFARPLVPDDVVWSYSGVRPLHDDRAHGPDAATRDYVLELEAAPGRAALLTVFGGKITTYRRLAEAALDRLAPYLPPQARDRAGWTRQAPLPGGDFAVDGLAALTAALAAEYEFLTPAHAGRLASAYGTRAKDILGGARTAADLGVRFGATLTQAEVRYLMTQEWARTADDVLWRRSKLGLALTGSETAALARFMASAGVTTPQDTERRTASTS
jgi:glycerol-3-phosphate dehydrogenase